jgi:uncharacterized membrane protein
MTGSKPASQRLDRLDALRGAAMVWMALFHGSFDLNQAGRFTPPQDFHGDPFWTWQRMAIVSLFLFCAGISQSQAQAAGQSTQRFWRRWWQIAGCALLVSIASAWMFPGSWISFGVLHGIAAMLLLLRISGRSRTHWLVVAGLLALLLPALVQHGFFDSRWTNWLGLVTRKPITEDYVPILPWFGVMLWGYAAGRRSAQRPTWLAGTLPALLTPLAKLGQWPLTFYMLHQPLLIGAISIWVALPGP